MKVLKITLIAALVSSSVCAQEIDNSWEVAIFGDYLKANNLKEHDLDWQNIEKGHSIGAEVRKVLNEYFDLRIEYAYSKYDIYNGNDTKGASHRYGLDAIYNFQNTDLYAFAGYKRFENTRNYDAINLGLGYNFTVSERVSLFAEAAVYNDVNHGFFDQGVKVGMKYSFGDSSPKAVQVSDSDGDGVNDMNDRCENTPITHKVDASGCTLYRDNVEKITLNVLFAHDRADVDMSNITDIKALADFMQKHNDTLVTIEGHSSEIGTEAYNLALSQKRANAVKNILVNDFSIQSNRITAVGYGETQPLDKGNSPEADAKNRRVNAVVEVTTKQAVTK